MTFDLGVFHCEIWECTNYCLIRILLNNTIIIRYYYEPEQYLKEYVKSTIVPTLIRKWLEEQLKD